MLYEDNEQVKELIREIMAKNKVTYRELAEKLDTSQQNIYKILNKPQLKFDDVARVCNALGYNFSFELSPQDAIVLQSPKMHKAFVSKKYEEILDESIERLIEKYIDKRLDELSKNNQKDVKDLPSS